MLYIVVHRYVTVKTAHGVPFIVVLWWFTNAVGRGAH